MSMIREIFRAVRITVVVWLLTAIIYPLFILLVGQSIFPFSANGSIISNVNAQPIGSTLIGQGFISDRYFHGRPSAVRYSQGQKAQPTGISGGSNFAPTNPQLQERILKQAEELQNENKQAVADLIYTSASGLDPHISLKAAREQIARVAQARGIKEDDIIPLITKYIDGRFLGIFGEPGINILRLNYALDLQDINRQQD
ncbi:MAG: potassium-transporting ATPase subunit C [Anabaena sp. CRKS33]|nr:MAG: potassium-transporting ATPase subunit C [Anabaena sp. CRKS33]